MTANLLNQFVDYIMLSTISTLPHALRSYSCIPLGCSEYLGHKNYASSTSVACMITLIYCDKIISCKSGMKIEEKITFSL